ncbi:hypothetical protein CNECB9_600018 [Cupriavidus necator]|uniref:Uncharacterized protein n=1 Tax=Cupriavidus necator TaxID=106590 RepID=A0A1K0IR36_CUPNE|nr:hypothetical protein CNECB9_600018 [Cupriavidus necator]
MLSDHRPGGGPGGYSAYAWRLAGWFTARLQILLGSVYAQVGVIGRIRPRYTPPLQTQSYKVSRYRDVYGPVHSDECLGGILSPTPLARSFGLPFSFMYTNSSSK